MRRAAKVLLTGFATLLLSTAALIIAVMPWPEASLINRSVLGGLGLGAALPVAAIAILPWLAVPDAAPRGKHFGVSMPRLVLRTAIVVIFTSLAIMILVPATLVMLGMLRDAFDSRNWRIIGIGGVMLPGLVLAWATGVYIFNTRVIQPWRWRRWPLLTVAADGLHIPGRPRIDWGMLVGTSIETSDYRGRMLLVAGPDTMPTLWLGPQPKPKLAINLADLDGSTRAVSKAITGHRQFRPGPSPSQHA